MTCRFIIKKRDLLKWKLLFLGINIRDVVNFASQSEQQAEHMDIDEPLSPPLYQLENDENFLELNETLPNNQCGENLDTSRESEVEYESDADSYQSNDSIQDASDLIDNFNYIGGDKFGSQIIFQKAELSVNDVMNMIIGFSLRFGLSYEAREKMAELIMCLAGPEYSDIKLTNYRMNKALKVPDTVIQQYFYCKNCNDEIFVKEPGVKEAACSKCKPAVINKLNADSPCRFSSLDIQYQVEILLQEKGVLQHILNENSKINNRNEKTYSSVRDGSLYIENVLNKRSDDRINLTLNFNADGVAVIRNSLTRVWELELMLNELPAKIREKRIILGGILIADHEPSPKLLNLFYTKFCEDVNYLNETGFTCIVENRQYNFRIKPLSSLQDAVARAISQNRLQFNGKFGCSFCYHPGEHLFNSMRYRFEMNASELRTDASHRIDVANANNSRKPSRGVKLGIAKLMDLKDFNMVWGLPNDYMHGVNLGVLKELISELFFNKSCMHYVRPSRVNVRLKAVKLSNDIHRLPRMIDGRVKWKANEYGNWNLYFSIPMLLDLVGEPLLEVLATFSGSIFKLRQESITERELCKVEDDLLKVTFHFENLFGVKFARFNVHCLTHLCECVRCSGNLCFNSCIAFENHNNFIKCQVKNAKGIDYQISKKSVEALLFKCKGVESENEVCKSFCDSLFSNKMVYTCQRTKSICDVTLLGKGVPSVNADELIFQRCLFNDVFYSSIEYTRCSTRDNSVIRLKCGETARIEQIVFNSYHRTVSLRVCVANRIANRIIDMLPHIQKVEFESSPVRKYVYFSEVSEKLLFLEFEGKQFACQLPNRFEMQ